MGVPGRVNISIRDKPENQKPMPGTSMEATAYREFASEVLEELKSQIGNDETQMSNKQKSLTSLKAGETKIEDSIYRAQEPGPLGRS